MSWHFSQELVEAYSEGSSSGGAPFVRSKLIRMQRGCSRRGRTTAAFLLSPFGTTLPRSMAGPGEALLTWFREASRVRISARPGEVQESRARVRDYGARCRGSLARWDRATCSWKTHQFSLLGGLESFSGTWPRWGMMRGGECWELTTPALPTSESGSGFWQTPVADDAVNRKEGKFNSRGEPKLSAQVVMFPTPPAGGHTQNKSAYPGAPIRPTLVGMARGKMWPTPRANEGRAGYYQNDQGDPSKPRLTLNGMVKLFPTPTVINDSGGGGDVQMGRSGCAGEAQNDGHSGGAQWSPEPDVGRVAHGVASRVDRLRCIGNGQVPDVVRLAWSLLRPIEEDEP